MSYKGKLIAFNNTKRYELELKRIVKEFKLKDKILDYGCGTGYAVDELKKIGYDVHGYDAIKHSSAFEYESAIGKWDVVYFMHSFAHIPGIKEVIKALDTRKIIIVTPNRDWIKDNHNPNYVPDETVQKHYTKEELILLLSECGFMVNCAEYITSNERIFIKCTKR